MNIDFSKKIYFFCKHVQFSLKKIKRIIKYGLPRKFDKHQIFKYNASLTAIIKNEAPYILEWIEYHRLIGFTRFYLYDNDSEDNLANVLAPYVEAGIVNLEHLHGKKQQLHAYELAIKKSKHESKWLAVIDLDEFITIKHSSSINAFLSEYDNRGISEILLGWKIFGSNNRRSKEEGLVIERFTRCGSSKAPIAYKAILNPRKFLDFLHPHYAFVTGKVIDGDGKRMYYYPFKEDKYLPSSLLENASINHYYTKSYDEFIAKSSRGFADGVETKRNARGKKDFDFYNRNEILDDRLTKYAPKIKNRISKLPTISW